MSRMRGELERRWQRLGLWPPGASRASIVGVRVNTLLTTPGAAVEELRHIGVETTRTAWSATALSVPLDHRDALVHSDAATSGRVYVQSLSSQLATLLLDPQPGEESLDLCAAPGGKTLHMAQLMTTAGRADEGVSLAAVESSRPRFFRLRANLERGGAAWVRTYLADGRGVGRKVAERFHRVLLDAPCSADGRLLTATGDDDGGDGQMRQGEWSLQKVRRLAAKQGQLLASAVQACRVGGTVLYATCTSSPEENEGVVNQALRRAGEALEIEPITPPEGLPPDVLRPGLASWEGEMYDPRLRHAVRVMPAHGFDVFFAARLRKVKALEASKSTVT